MKQNNWYVITGAPSSGKTTVIEELKKQKYRVIYELARVFIDQELKKGKTLQEIRKDESIFQKKVLQLKIDTENELKPSDIVFLDRGIPDSLAYYKLIHTPPTPLLIKAVKNAHYKKVFLFEQLDYQKDYARTESKEESQRLHFLLEETYNALAIPVIFVPKMSVKKRVKFILRNL